MVLLNLRELQREHPIILTYARAYLLAHSLADLLTNLRELQREHPIVLIVLDLKGMRYATLFETQAAHVYRPLEV